MGAAACLLTAPCLLIPSAFGQEETLIVADEDFIITADDGLIVSEGEEVVGTEGAANAWDAIPIAPRMSDDQSYFYRQTSDAFVDPDQRQSLEAKYYFQLDREAFSEANPFTRRVENHEAAAGGKLILPDGTVWDLANHPAAGALSAERERNLPAAVWIKDTGAKPTTTAILFPAVEDEPAKLALYQAQAEGDTLRARKLLQEVPLTGRTLVGSPASALDALGRPPEFVAQKLFVAPVIAVLVNVDGRWGVDFFGPRLEESAQCRLWLGPAASEQGESELGEPLVARFRQIPVRRPEGNIDWVSVLAITWQTAEGTREIAVDYPLCSPPILEQLRKVAANRAGNSGSNTDLTKLVGEALVDELSRRLVNGQYQ